MIINKYILMNTYEYLMNTKEFNEIINFENSKKKIINKNKTKNIEIDLNFYIILIIQKNNKSYLFYIRSK